MKPSSYTALSAFIGANQRPIIFNTDLDSTLVSVERSAQGAAARRQGGKELASPFGGARDTTTVLRVFRKPPA